MPDPQKCVKYTKEKRFPSKGYLQREAEVLLEIGGDSGVDEPGT